MGIYSFVESCVGAPLELTCPQGSNCEKMNWEGQQQSRNKGVEGQNGMNKGTEGVKPPTPLSI